jgi:peptidoglycan/xylan/chitin deacetylase (PgdA/CDA1 family)
MRFLHEEGYVTLSADEVVQYLKGNYPPNKKVVAVHFDDGWKSALLALPVLDAYGFKATFWIIAGKGIGQPHMDWEEIQAIAQNPHYDIFSHTMRHPWKPNDTMLDWINGKTPGKGPDQVRWELTESRRVLTEKIGRQVTYLAWPVGFYNDSLIELAKESGYVALFTVDKGVNYPGDDPLKIRRTMIHGACDNQAFAQILQDGISHKCEERAAALPK